MFLLFINIYALSHILYNAENEFAFVEEDFAVYNCYGIFMHKYNIQILLKFMISFQRLTSKSILNIFIEKLSRNVRNMLRKFL